MFLGKERMHPFVHLSIVFWLYTALQCQSTMSSNSLVFHTYGGISSSLAAFLFSKKSDLGLTKNYRGITFTPIAAKIYNALQRNRIEPKIEKIIRKNQNGFRGNRSTISQILTIRRILEGVRTKKPRDNNGVWLHTQREDGANTTRLWPTQRSRRSHNNAI